MSTGRLPSFGHDYLVIILTVLLLTVGLYIYLNYSKHGYELNVVGESVRTARYVGISVGKVIIRTMVLSGALCGLAGYLIGAGLDRSVTTDSVGGQGFTAIMVAWLAKFDPLMMILTAGVIIFLNQGADQISTSFEISGALPNVIIGIVLFFIIGSEFFINYKLNFRKREPKEAVR
jgi:simple sugar transport system permease protein